MVSFKLFAGTNIGLRDNNEDNFTVCRDLINGEWITPVDNDNAIRLGEKGCLMVVADGMGGQNAGEVASAIAIDTVREMFSSMSDNVIKKDESIIIFLKKVIIEADTRVKNHSKKDSSTSGMGSTIIIAWVLQGSVYIAWLGDSRAYSYIPNKGIGRLSKDHSYVQQLVDAGTISDDDAMIHPNSNIITRSLGDFSQKAKPDVIKYPISEGEIILLCTDGLCGVCRDEEIGAIIEEYHDDLQRCKERLTLAALSNGGSDNITVALLDVIQMTGSEKRDDPQHQSMKQVSIKSLILTIIAIALLVITSLIYFIPKPLAPEISNETIPTDTENINPKTPIYTPPSGNEKDAEMRPADSKKIDSGVSTSRPKSFLDSISIHDLDPESIVVTPSNESGQDQVNKIDSIH